MNREDIEKILNTDIQRYSSFTVFKNPVIFRKEWAQKPYDAVQIHQIMRTSNEMFCTFVGVFRWDGKDITPLDGDVYVSDMQVYAFDEFAFRDEITGNICIGLDIVVEDW